MRESCEPCSWDGDVPHGSLSKTGLPPPACTIRPRSKDDKIVRQRPLIAPTHRGHDRSRPKGDRVTKRKQTLITRNKVTEGSFRRKTAPEHQDFATERPGLRSPNRCTKPKSINEKEDEEELLPRIEMLAGLRVARASTTATARAPGWILQMTCWHAASCK